MKIISIAELKTLVMDRLSNPSSYKDKTLVVWNCRMDKDSIIYRVVKNCCISHNRANKDSQVWFNYISTFSVEGRWGVDCKEACCDVDDMYGYKMKGVLLDSGYISFLKTSDEKLMPDWLHFINTHEVDGAMLSDDWALITCAHAEYGYKEDDFSDNCEIVRILPSADWEEFMTGPLKKEILHTVLAFIEKNGITTEPDMWEKIIINLSEDFYDEHITLDSIPESFIMHIFGLDPTFPKKDFIDFLRSYNNG